MKRKRPSVVPIVAQRKTSLPCARWTSIQGTAKTVTPEPIEPRVFATNKRWTRVSRRRSFIAEAKRNNRPRKRTNAMNACFRWTVCCPRNGQSLSRCPLDGARLFSIVRAMSPAGNRSTVTFFLSFAVMTASALAKPDTRNRADIPAQYKWDFSAIYPSWEAWDGAVKDMEARMDKFAALKGSLSQG